MRKFLFLTALTAIIPFLFCDLVVAKRMPPKNVKPLVYKGIVFIAPRQKMCYVEARDFKTNKKVWEKKVYGIIYDPFLEKDVQDVFITSLGIEGNKLVVTDERGKIYRMEIPKNILKGRFSDRPYYLPPWARQAPYPYENDDQPLVWESYEEKWSQSAVENFPEAFRKAKEALQEWGQNPDVYEYRGGNYDYAINVSESANFISVVFSPVGLEELERHVEVRLIKKDLAILFILPGV
jgi:hypothetical protein